MEKRELNISYYKAGNGVASRMNIPITWLRKIGVTPENKTVELILDEENNQLVIKQK